MLKVFGFGASFPANKVRMCVNALGLEHEYINVNLPAGEQRSDEFLAINPKGKVPAINDDGFCLSESNAIIRYLAQKAGRLYPEDLQEQAIVDQWLYFVSDHVGLGISKVMFNKVFAPMLNIEVDERSLKEGYSFLDKYLPIIEEQLGKSSFLASDQLSIADVALIATLDPTSLLEIDLGGYPALSKYLETQHASDWYRACHQYFGEGIFPG